MYKNYFHKIFDSLLATFEFLIRGDIELALAFFFTEQGCIGMLIVVAIIALIIRLSV